MEKTQDTVEALSKALVIRVLAVYRDEYIEHCLKDEPESLLGLAKRLELVLVAKGEKFQVAANWLTPMPGKKVS